MQTEEVIVPMKRTIAIVAIVAVALAGAVFAVRQVFFDDQVVATGYLQPVSVSDLNFGASAPVTEVLVHDDEVVRAGQVLARQDTSALEAQLAAHQATLVADQIALAYQQDPTTPPELQQLDLATGTAQAQLDAARQKAAGSVNLDDAVVTSAAGGVDTARAALAADQAQAASMASACASVTAAASASGTASADATSDVFATATTGVPITLPPPTLPKVNTQLLGMCNDLARRITTGESNVAGAEHDYEVAVARRDLSATTAGSSIDSAQQQLAMALTKQAVGSEPATPSGLAVAQAAISQDTIAIAQLRKDVDAAVLVAPRDGIVRQIGGEVGEVAGPEGVRVYGSPQALPQKQSNGGINLFPSAPQQPAQQSQQFKALITLDSAALEVVAQVPEDEVTTLRPGQVVTVSFPALDDETVGGRIARIEPEAVNNDGNVSFLVDVVLDHEPASGSTGGRSPQRMVGITANVRF